MIRPERVRVEPYESRGDNRVPGMIERVVYLGASEQLVVRLATGDVVQALFVNDGTPRELAQGTPVQVHLPVEALRVLPPPPPPPYQARRCRGLPPPPPPPPGGPPDGPRGGGLSYVD